ncbi:MAG: 16S rRNA (adenine(1518)-N(6)/adenine(1519)-N(6))-dimethyltransferase RsmA [Patescibacteria group bacterium]
MNKKCQSFLSMSLIAEIRQVCQKYSIKPLRKRGQNFLINPKIYAKIIEAAELKKDDIILEIGAGLGNLTRQLAERVKKVIAVEIDKRLIEILKKQLADYRNIEIVQGDIRNFQFSIFNFQINSVPTGHLTKGDKFQIPNLKIIGNIPYNLTGIILRKFLSEKLKPKLMVLMLQKEVAQRIVARPPKMSLLSVMVQFYGQPKIISYVSKNNFWPRPKVDSAILRISTTNIQIDEKKFFEVLRAGFSAPRKYLLNNLIKKSIIDKEQGEKIFRKLNLNLKIRAQELSVGDWIKLYNMMLI